SQTFEDIPRRLHPAQHAHARATGGQPLYPPFRRAGAALRALALHPSLRPPSRGGGSDHRDHRAVRPDAVRSAVERARAGQRASGGAHDLRDQSGNHSASLGRGVLGGELAVAGGRSDDSRPGQHRDRTDRLPAVSRVAHRRDDGDRIRAGSDRSRFRGAQLRDDGLDLAVVDRPQVGAARRHAPTAAPGCGAVVKALRAPGTRGEPGRLVDATSVGAAVVVSIAAIWLVTGSFTVALAYAGGLGVFGFIAYSAAKRRSTPAAGADGVPDW